MERPHKESPGATRIIDAISIKGNALGTNHGHRALEEIIKLAMGTLDEDALGHVFHSCWDSMSTKARAELMKSEEVVDLLGSWGGDLQEEEAPVEDEKAPDEGRAFSKVSTSCENCSVVMDLTKRLCDSCAPLFWESATSERELE